MIGVGCAGRDAALSGEELAEAIGEARPIDFGDVFAAVDAAQLLARRAEHPLGGGIGVGEAGRWRRW